MLFHIGFLLVNLILLLTGFLMFAFPAQYVRIVSWYFAKIRMARTMSITKYSGWAYRISGLLLFFVGVMILWQYVVLLQKH